MGGPPWGVFRWSFFSIPFLPALLLQQKLFVFWGYRERLIDRILLLFWVLNEGACISMKQNMD
jgi:hypothetical protein